MDDAFLALEKAIPKREIDALKDIVIFKEPDGTYNIYSKYNVRRNEDGTFTVLVLGTYTNKNFYKLKNAVAWCSFDKRNLIKEAKRLHQLDQMIFGIDTEMQLHSRLIKKSSNIDVKMIYVSKLTNERAKKRKFSSELSRFLNEAERWQLNRFNTKPKY